MAAGATAEAVDDALDALEAAAREGRNIMEPSIVAPRPGVTTGEWGEALRQVFGEYRAPTGVSLETRAPEVGARRATSGGRARRKLGETPRLVVGKPGLDGHSNGAEQVALRARDVGMEVTYDGIRQTPAEIVARARETRRT